MIRFTISVFLWALLGSSRLWAESLTPLNVVEVRSAGIWSDKSGEGRYRVVVREEGWEHVTNRLQVQWIRGAKSPNEDEALVTAVEPDLPFNRGMTAFGVTVVPIRKNCLKIEVKGVNSLDPRMATHIVFLAKGPGEVKLTKRGVHKKFC